MKDFIKNNISISVYFAYIIFLSFASTSCILAQAEEKPLKINNLSVEQCIEISEKREKEGQYKEATRFLNQAATICWEKKNLDEAIRYYTKSIQLNALLNNEHGITAIYSNLGLIYADKKDYQKSLEYFQKTLDGRKDSPDKSNKISTLINISIVLNNLKQYSNAAARLQIALNLAKELNDPDEIKKCYGMLAETYEKAGNSDSTIYYFNFYRSFHEYVQKEKMDKFKSDAEQSKLKTALLELENRNRELELLSKNSMIGKMSKELLEFDSTTRALYDTLSQTQLIIEILRKNSKIKELQISEDQNRIQKERELKYFLFGGVILLLIIILLLVRRYYANKKASLKLQKQHDEILLQQRRITEQNIKLEAVYKELKTDKETLEKYTIQLKELNATKDKFFSIIAHDLKNPFQSLLGFSELLKTNFKYFEPEKIEHFVNQIYTASRHGFLLLENLLDWARTQTDTLSFRPEKVNLKESVIRCISLTERQAMNKNIKITNNIENPIFVNTDNNLLMTVLRNLLTNAIKFTPREGIITIKAGENGEQTKISIADTGIGIPENILINIFSIDVKHNALGTENEKGTGLGLILCKEFVKKMGGEIRAESTEGRGSEFIFTVPKYKQ